MKSLATFPMYLRSCFSISNGESSVLVMFHVISCHGNYNAHQTEGWVRESYCANKGRNTLELLPH
jgi:hypothetical protein